MKLYTAAAFLMFVTLVTARPRHRGGMGRGAPKVGSRRWMRRCSYVDVELNAENFKAAIDYLNNSEDELIKDDEEGLLCRLGDYLRDFLHFRPKQLREVFNRKDFDLDEVKGFVDYVNERIASHEKWAEIFVPIKEIVPLVPEVEPVVPPMQ